MYSTVDLNRIRGEISGIVIKCISTPISDKGELRGVFASVLVSLNVCCLYLILTRSPCSWPNETKFTLRGKLLNMTRCKQIWLRMTFISYYHRFLLWHSIMSLLCGIGLALCPPSSVHRIANKPCLFTNTCTRVCILSQH